MDQAHPRQPCPAAPSGTDRGRALIAAASASALILSVLSTLPGCATSGRGGGRGGIAEVHLFAAPTALNLDFQPGPDSIGVRLYVSSAAAARGIPIKQGTLEVLMFDGSVSESVLRSGSARKTWTFTPANLPAFASETSLGVGYQLALNWDKSPPKEPVVTVVARYRNPAGREIYSASNTIFVSTR